MPVLNPPPCQWPGEGRVIVAFSGGADSLCLLHRLRVDDCKRSITCLHIDHGLDGASGERARTATRLAMEAGIDCHVVRVEVRKGIGPEAAARRARYDAIETFMQSGDVVLTAHHADDQVETVLMRLLRGAAPAGLGGIPRQRRFGPGWLVRPLLDWNRAEIERFIREHDLSPVHDPANDSPQIDRNFIGQQLVPIIRQRWPGAERSILRSARLCHGAAEALAELAVEDLDRLTITPTCIRLNDPGQWNAFRLGEMLRHWCYRQGLTAPPGRRIETFLRQIERASIDRQPMMSWDEGIIRLWRGRLWLQSSPEPPCDWSLEWCRGRMLVLPGDIGCLELTGVDHPPAPLTIQSARPGDRLRPAGQTHHRPVTQLLAERDIPPWQRDSWPRIWLHDRLAGVGDVWQSETLERYLKAAGTELRWQTSHHRGC
jgi:tRNA(Ile)-lysidine synthase